MSGAAGASAAAAGAPAGTDAAAGARTGGVKRRRWDAGNTATADAAAAAAPAPATIAAAPVAGPSLPPTTTSVGGSSSSSAFGGTGAGAIPRSVLRAAGAKSTNLPLPSKHKQRKAAAAAATAAAATAAHTAAAAGPISYAPTPRLDSAGASSAATAGAATPAPAAAPAPALPSDPLAAALERAKQAALLQRQIQEKMKALGIPTGATGPLATATTGVSAAPAAAAPAGPAALPAAASIAERLAAAKAAAAAAAAQKQAAALQSAVGALGGAAPPLTLPTGTSVAVGAALAALQAAQQQRAAAAGGPAWKPLLLDAQGREIDESGKVVRPTARTSHATLKVNIAMDEKKKDEALLTPAEIKRLAMGQSAAAALDSTVSNKYVDPTLTAKKGVKERKARSGFHFVEDQKHARAAEMMRVRNISREIRTQKDFGPDTSVASSAIVKKLFASATAAVPNVEWWDAKLLSDGDSYDSAPLLERVTHYMHIPVEIAPAVQAPAPAPLPLMLTKAERKKMNHKAKMEKQREQRDLIQLGLAPAPEPRVKLSNMYRVLGSDAVSDPSAMEAKVRRQMAERKHKHEQANADRALTKEQKWEKKIAKLKDEKKHELQTAVYVVGDLTDEKRRLKIDRNAQQLTLTGLGLINVECNVLVCEGGVRALKKFTRLLTHRINWKTTKPQSAGLLAPDAAAAAGAGAAGAGAGDGTAMVDDVDKAEKAAAAAEAGAGGDDDDDDDAAGASDSRGPPRAFVVWQGVVPRPAFKSFRFEHCRSELMARKFLEDKGCAHYWDMARGFKPPAGADAPTA